MIKVFHEGKVAAEVDTPEQAAALIKALASSAASHRTAPMYLNGTKALPVVVKKFAEFAISNRGKEVNGHDMAKVFGVEPPGVGPVTRGLRRVLHERGINLDDVFVRLNADDGAPARWTLHPNAELKKLVEEGV
jgi:hypothetical protein